MSTVFELDEAGWDQRIADARLQQPAQADPDFTDNLFSGVGNGLMRGLASVGRGVAVAASVPMVLAEKSLGTEGILTDKYFSAVDEYANDAVDFWTPDQRTVGTAGRVLGGLAEIVGPLAATGGNPSLLIASQQLGTATDLTRQGVDPTTANIVGTAQGAATAVGFKIPIIGKTLGQRVMSSAVGNVGVSMATTFAQRMALEKSGYDELAEQYDPLDAEGRTVDLLIGAAFGFIPQGSSGPHVQPSARNAILAGANARHFQVDTAPGRPLDAAASVAHQQAMETALKQLLDGDPVNVPPEVLEANFEPRNQQPDLNARLDSFIDERRSMLDEGGDPNDPLANALWQAAGPSIDTGGIQDAARWAMENGRPDIAQAAAERAERSAEKAAEAKPGLSPDSPKYQVALDALKRAAEQAKELAEKVRAIAGKAKESKRASEPLDLKAVSEIIGELPDKDAFYNRKPPTRGDGVARMHSQLEREAAIIAEVMGRDPSLTRGDAIRIAKERMLAEDAAPAEPVAPFKYEPGTRLTEADSAIERKFGEEIGRDLPAAEARYAALEESKGGKVLNTDVARELSPEYLKDRTKSSAVHEPASALIQRLYAKKLAEAPKKGERPLVLFTAGGTGAGKTTAISKALGPLADTAQIIYDTNMNWLDSAVRKIDQALAAGKDVTIAYTYRDPIESLRHGALTRAMRQEAEHGSGRTVPLVEHLRTHIGSREAIERIAAHYAGDARVRVHVIDNSKGSGKAESVKLGAIPKLGAEAYNTLREQAVHTLEAEREAGRISDAVYRGFAADTGADLGTQPRAVQQPGDPGARGGTEQSNDGVTPKFETTAGEPPKPGQPFLVIRLGRNPALTNRNAGNPQGVANFLARLDDDFEGSKPAGTSADNTLFVHRVTAPAEFSKYEQAAGAKPLKGDSIGRSSDKNGVIYSFPEGKFESEMVSQMPMSEVRAELKKLTGTDNFDDLGSIKGGKALEQILGKLTKADEPVKAKTQTVSTAAGRKIEVESKVIELDDAVTSDKPNYPQELQPRQRGARKQLDQRVRDIAKDLDPERLGHSAEADRGAPITGKGNIVESGNGRVMALRYAYENLPEKAAEYRAFLESQGYDVKGMKQPVLVRERITELDNSERRAFTVEANQAATAALSPVERAMADAHLLDAATLSAMRGGELTTAQNAGFVRAFLERVTGSERNAMLNPDGSISQEGVRRLQAALLAKAYGGKPESNITLGRMLESTDSDMRSALGAMLDAAPAFARLRQSIAEGKVSGEYDISGALTEAIENTAKLRLTGQSLRDFLAQGDMLTKRAPIVDSLMKALYDKSGTRIAGREKIAATLQKYAGQAARQRLDQASLFAEPPVGVDELVDSTTTEAEPQAPKVSDMFGLRTPQTNLATQAAKAALEVNDIEVPTGAVDAEGNMEVRSGREMMAEAEAGIEKAEADSKGIEAAVSCILTKGLDDAA